MSKGLHPKPNSNFEQQIESGSNALGNFLCIVLAGIVVLFICSDANTQISQAVHHEHHEVNVLHWLGLI